MAYGFGSKRNVGSRTGSAVAIGKPSVVWRDSSRKAPVPIFCANLCIIPLMNPHAPLQTLTRRRRPSRLSGWLASKKIEEARRMTPEERLLLALELSDFCVELQLACSAKR